MSTVNSYPAKLLLFGEYSVLSGSRALAIPLPMWHGILKTRGLQPDQDLLLLSRYLDENKIFSAESCEKFHEAVETGLYFDSNIPRGYGAGSSGALCAAIYDKFFSGETHTGDLSKIRELLSTMEGHFHGKSSGMDPLVSLMKTPVLREMNNYHMLTGLICPNGLQIFLLDSGIQRKSDQLVNQYTDWTSQESFQMNCLRPLVQSVDHAISFFIDSHLPAFWEHLKLISSLQYSCFKPMITHTMSAIWENTLVHPDVAMKLCGAGGGGFYLGFAQKGIDINTIFPEEALVTVILR